MANRDTRKQFAVVIAELAWLALTRCFAFVSRERRPRLAFCRYCWICLCLAHFIGYCQLAVVDKWDDSLLDVVDVVFARDLDEHGISPSGCLCFGSRGRYGEIKLAPRRAHEAA